jgi:hypothetical protein
MWNVSAGWLCHYTNFFAFVPGVLSSKTEWIMTLSITVTDSHFYTKYFLVGYSPLVYI